MSTTTLASDIAADCRVVIGDDRLRAYVAPLTGFAAAEVTPRLIEDRLGEAGLALPDALRDQLTPLLHHGRLTLEKPLLVARGTDPVDATPARLERVADETPADDPEVTDHYHRSRLHTVRAGQLVARLCPATPGRDGLDVFGHPVPCKTAPAFHPSLGANVSLDDATGQITAACDGTLKIDGAKIWVEDCLHLKSDVDFSTGNVYFAGDLVIDGSVADLFEIKARNITVHKAIEGAHVTAERSLHADGGIIGKDKAHVSAGQELAVRFITAATVTCDGPVTVLAEISNAKLACRGKLTLVKGTILHSKISAAGGVSARSVGSPAEAPTLVEVGLTEEQSRPYAHRLAELHEHQAQHAHMRRQLESALARSDRLTPQQKAKATTLLAHLTRQEREVTTQLTTLAAEWQSLLSTTHAEIEVHDRIHPGTTLRLAGLELTLREPLRGPLRLSVRGDGFARHIIATLLTRHATLQLGGTQTDSRTTLHHLTTPVTQAA